MKAKLWNLTQNRVLSSKVRYCNRFFSRLKGLLGTSKIEVDEACWLIPCSGIHTLGMRYAIDAYFLNRENEVLAVVRNLKPNRLSPIFRSAHSVLEFAAGFSDRCRVGDKIGWEAHS